MRLGLQPKQARAFLSRGTETLFGGAAFGGKSHLMRVAAIGWCMEIPGLQVYIFRRTYPDLWSNHIEGPSGFPAMLAELVESGHVKINYGAGKISFWNGSAIFLRHCQYEKDVYNYQGAEIHVLMVDELTQWLKTMYLYLRGRVRMVGIALPEKYRSLFPRVLCGANPGGIGHNWVKSMWIDLGPGLHQMPKVEGGMIREYIPARLEDNPLGVQADPTYEQRLEGLGNAALVRAMRLGDWDIVAGGALDDVWQRDKHVIKPFNIPASWRIDRSFDWGSSHPFSVGWWAESDGTPAKLRDGREKHFPRGTLFRIGEWYGWNGQPNEGARIEDVEVGRGIKDLEDTLRKALNFTQPILPGPADGSIFDADPGKDSIAKGLEKGYGRRGLFVPADKSPGSRKNGLEVMRRMLKVVLSDRPEEPGLYVFDTCTQGFIRTVPVLPRSKRDPDDVDSDAEDHCLAGDTLVMTSEGEKKIADMVGTEGYVLTVDGAYAPYSDCKKTRRAATVINVHFDDGRIVTCTPDHRFLSDRGEWVEAANLLGLRVFDTITHHINRRRQCRLRSLAIRFKRLMASAIGDAASIFRDMARGSIEPYGNFTKAKFLKIITFTMSTRIGLITKSKTCNCSKARAMRGITEKLATVIIGRKPCGPGRESGTQARLDGDFIKSITRSIAKAHLLRKRNWCASSAERHISERAGGSARTTASQHGAERIKSTISSIDAQYAEKSKWSTSTRTGKRARGSAGQFLNAPVVVAITEAGLADTYCLNAETTHSFAVAGGIIVHNCYDDARYRVTAAKRDARRVKITGV